MYEKIAELCTQIDLHDFTPQDMVVFCRKAIRTWVFYDLDMHDDLIVPFVAIESETGHLFANLPDADSAPIPMSPSPSTLTGESLEAEIDGVFRLFHDEFVDSVIGLKAFPNAGVAP